jgi:hypothetical protein
MKTIADEPETNEQAVRASEDLMRHVARLKLRLQACLRQERGAQVYEATLVRCLDDVRKIVQAASAWR